MEIKLNKTVATGLIRSVINVGPEDIVSLQGPIYQAETTALCVTCDAAGGNAPRFRMTIEDKVSGLRRRMYYIPNTLRRDLERESYEQTDEFLTDLREHLLSMGPFGAQMYVDRLFQDAEK